MEKKIENRARPFLHNSYDDHPDPENSGFESRQEKEVYRYKKSKKKERNENLI